MSVTSGFFNAVFNEGVPDKTYDAHHFAEYFSAFIGNGVFAHNLEELKPTVCDDNLSVVVKSGRAYINGYWLNSSSDEIVSFDSNQNQLPRWDAIILKLNLTTRAITLEAKQGGNFDTYTSGKTYIYNNITRTENIFELCLGIVRVPELASTYQFTAADIYDVRAEQYCGWVTGLVDQLDTSTITEQLQAEFNLWFENVKGQLSDDAAGNLQNQINTLNTSVDTAMANVSAIDQMVQSMYEELDKVRAQIFYTTPFTLFENVRGETDTIRFNRGISEFDEIQIYYCDNNLQNLSIKRIPNPTPDQSIILATVGDGREYATYIRHSAYNLQENAMYIEDNSASITSFSRSTASQDERAVSQYIRYGKYIKITKVVGIGDKNYAPKDGYNEVQTDTIIDEVRVDEV